MPFQSMMNLGPFNKVLALIALGVSACASTPAAVEEDPWPLECAFIPVEESTDRDAQCARRDPGGDIVVRRDAAAEHVPPGAVSAVVVDEVLLYVVSSGKTAPALWFDNGTDYFVEGLARTVRNGKIGFVDTSLTEVIPPSWDFAFPYDKGLAVVCSGCTSRPVGEHSEIVGGKWGYIDSRGDVVVPLIHGRDELPSRQQLEER